MISRKLIWFIAVVFAALLIITWFAGRHPARVAIINQAVPLRNVTLYAGEEPFDIGEVRRGETRTVVIPPGRYLELRYTTSSERVWRLHQKVAPAQALVLYVRPNERVELRSTLGRR